MRRVTSFLTREKHTSSHCGTRFVVAPRFNICLGPIQNGRFVESLFDGIIDEHGSDSARLGAHNKELVDPEH
jgi:hypothetical protein